MRPCQQMHHQPDRRRTRLHSRIHLARVMKRLRTVDGVLRVTRSARWDMVSGVNRERDRRV